MVHGLDPKQGGSAELTVEEAAARLTRAKVQLGPLQCTRSQPHPMLLQRADSIRLQSLLWLSAGLCEGLLQRC